MSVNSNCKNSHASIHGDEMNTTTHITASANTEAKLAWSKAVIVNPLCMSDETTGSLGLNTSRGTARNYRLGQTGDLEISTWKSLSKKNLLAMMPSKMRLKEPAIVYMGTVSYIVEEAFMSDDERLLDGIVNSTNDLISAFPDLRGPLLYSQGLAYLIWGSGSPRTKYITYKKAKVIFEKALEVEELDPHWEVMALSGNLFCDYMFEKYFSSEDNSVNPDKIKGMLEHSETIALSNYSMSAWLNHVEYSSVAESSHHLQVGLDGVDEMIKTRSSVKSKQDYVREAVNVVLDSRDGKAFRDSQTIKSGDAA